MSLKISDLPFLENYKEKTTENNGDRTNHYIHKMLIEIRTVLMTFFFGKKVRSGFMMKALISRNFTVLKMEVV